mgnify:CR=1 FL=1
MILKYLLVFVATLESFAHGANDTANATAPLGDTGLWKPTEGGAMTKDEANAKLTEAREKMFGGAPKGKVDADQRAKRERYAENGRAPWGGGG